MASKINGFKIKVFKMQIQIQIHISKCNLSSLIAQPAKINPQQF